MTDRHNTLKNLLYFAIFVAGLLFIYVVLSGYADGWTFFGLPVSGFY